MNSRSSRKAEIEHLVGLVEHDRLQRRDVETAALDDGRAGARACRRRYARPLEQRRFAARIHAADAGDHAGARLRMSQGELALDLQRSSRVGAMISASGARAAERSALPSRVSPMASP